ncbi:MAG: glycoside hydrolase family 2 protein [Oligosphaeraceae bacterium]
MLPRPEYPRMQFRRADWLNLNGEWSFAFDPVHSGEERGWGKSQGFGEKIQVPFAPETPLSGVEHTDFITGIFYHRQVTVPAAWENRRILLNFGAVYNDAKVWWNGEEVAWHRGGSTPFTVDLTGRAHAGQTYDLVVEAQSDVRSTVQSTGKQCLYMNSQGCSYRRTTGIWQTVDLEAAGLVGLKDCQVVADFDNHAFVFRPAFFQETPGATLTVEIREGDALVATAKCAATLTATLTLPLENPRPWCPDDPFLYDIRYIVREKDGSVSDVVDSYAGMRKVHVSGNRLYLNNHPIFLRMVLDQGFYPEGNWTAPDDEALVKDILFAKACGFNAARLHQKVFEPRYLYHADRLGYLVWGEFPCWGQGWCQTCFKEHTNFYESFTNFLEEWGEEVVRDRNHPSILMWTPLNESDIYLTENSMRRYREGVARMYAFTKALDPTRPVHDSSGWGHAKTDIWSIHAYCASAGEMEPFLLPNKQKGFPTVRPEFDTGYQGQPYYVDEFGGFRYLPPEVRGSTQEGWGYFGLDFQNAEELVERIREQVALMNQTPDIMGWCYTQLTDVEQEQNGLMTYHRIPKADPELFRKAFLAD